MESFDQPESGVKADDDAFGMPAEEPRRTLRILFSASVVLFVLGILFFWPYLEQEHRRMDPSMSLLVWGSDLIGLAWFTWYFTRHSVLGAPFRHGTSATPRLTRLWWLALISLTAAIVYDLWVTYRLWDDEQAGLARAVVVQGEIRAVERKSAAEYHSYHLECRFQDGQGLWQEGSFTVLEHRRTRQFKDALPAEVQQALRNGRMPCPIRIAYDPMLPARNWLAGIDADQGSRFHAFAWCIRLFQGIAIFNFVVLLRQAVQRQAACPGGTICTWPCHSWSRPPSWAASAP
jgi:hypothetical protein